MSEYNVIFHADTKVDYNTAYAWYETQQKGLGNKFLAAIRSKISQIAATPDIYGEKSKKGI